MFRFDRWPIFCLIFFGTQACHAQETDEAPQPFIYPKSFDLTTPIPESELMQLFTTIPPTGDRLPAGNGTFSEGKLVYEAQCVACHGKTLQGEAAGRPLLGGRNTLTSAEPMKTVESYWPYATSVYSYIRNTMPTTAPGTLTDDEVYALMAYILGSADIVPKDIVVTKSTLVAVEMPNRNGFVKDERPDVARFSTASQPESPDYAQDVSRVTSVIEAIGVFVDFGEFEAVCQLYEDVSTSDYSSLWNNKPSSGSPSDRATGWSGFIPGFDLTRHEINVSRVQIDGDVAIAAASVKADHWLAGERWSISGVYDAKLRKHDGRWRIFDWVFTLNDERGDRVLVDLAEEKAKTMIERPIKCPLDKAKRIKSDLA